MEARFAIVGHLSVASMAITLICESPLLDKDALFMKEVLERHGVKLS